MIPASYVLHVLKMTVMIQMKELSFYKIHGTLQDILHVWPKVNPALFNCIREEISVFCLSSSKILSDHIALFAYRFSLGNSHRDIVADATASYG